jgi:hypothetical protein
MMCTLWLAPVTLSANHGFSSRELNRISALTLEHLGPILEAWHDQ